MTVPQQSVDNVGDACYFGDEPLTCIIDQYTVAFGSDALFGLLIGVVLFMSLYFAGDGDMATPTVALILLGGVLIPTLPGSYAQIGMSIVTIGLAVALWQVIKRYVLSAGAQV
jgi:hypothetical protein